MANFTFLLKVTGDLNRHEQYSVLKKIVTPCMKNHGVYADAAWGVNPKDFRGAIFYPANYSVAKMIKRNVEQTIAAVECQIWASIDSNYVDRQGRSVMQVQSVEVYDN